MTQRREASGRVFELLRVHLVLILLCMFVAEVPLASAQFANFAGFPSAVPGTALTGVDFPSDIAMDASGNLYMVDGSAGNVYKFTHQSGTYVKSVLYSNTAVLANNNGIAVDATGDLILSLRCNLARVLDLTDDLFTRELGTTRNELVSLMPSRFILNARGEITPTQTLGAACSFSGRISALKVPSAINQSEYCLDIFPDSLQVGENVAILDDSERIKATIIGFIPSTTAKQR